MGLKYRSRLTCTHRCSKRFRFPICHICVFEVFFISIFLTFDKLAESMTVDTDLKTHHVCSIDMWRFHGVDFCKLICFKSRHCLVFRFLRELATRYKFSEFSVRESGHTITLTELLRRNQTDDEGMQHCNSRLSGRTVMANICQCLFGVLARADGL